MEISTKENGRMDFTKAKAHFGILMEVGTLVIGRTTRGMDKGRYSTSTVKPGGRACGKTTEESREF
jgi:hypothetical protein